MRNRLLILLFLLHCGAFAQSNMQDTISKKMQQQFKHLRSETENTYKYGAYEGATIRHIYITVLSPMGTNINDTSVKAKGFIRDVVNNTHPNSNQHIVRNYLLYKEGKPLKKIEIEESERLLRRSLRVRDAKTVIKPAGEGMVDVYVIVQDLISITINTSAFDTVKSYGITFNNIAGYNQSFANEVNYSEKDKQHYSYNGIYTWPNMFGSFFNGSLYFSTPSGVSQNGVSISKSFYSPLTSWNAGAEYFDYTKDVISYYSGDSTSTARIKYNTEDVWAGKAFNVKTKYKVYRDRLKIFTSARVIQTNYTSRNKQIPVFNQDDYKTNTFYLADVGVSYRSYYKEKYLFKFGNNEDIPEGVMIAYIPGYRHIEGARDLLYSAVEARQGKFYPKIGYLSFDAGFGTFFNSSKAQQGILSFGITHITKKWNIRKFGIRHYALLKAKQGFNRQPDEQIYLSTEDGLYNLTTHELSGISKLSLSLNTVVYTPYKLLGFNLAVFVYAGFATITPNSINLKNTIYQAFGAGIMVRNDHLIINNIRLSFTYYPNLPVPVGKFNPYWFYAISLPEFIMDKPEALNYD